MKWNLWLGVYQKRDGDMLPPWYYGYAYRNEWSQVIVFYPIPLHFFVRVGQMFAQGWRMFRLYGLESDWAQEERMTCLMYREGYDRGKHDGKLEWMRKSLIIEREVSVPITAERV